MLQYFTSWLFLDIIRYTQISTFTIKLHDGEKMTPESAIFVIGAFLVVHWYSSLSCHRIFQHQYAAHAMFTMSPRMEKIFYLISFLTQGASFLRASTYALIHRPHHAYSDTEKDPHSPSFSRNIFHMMWRTRSIYKKLSSGTKLYDKGLEREYIPFWKTFEDFADSWPARIVWMALYTIFYVAVVPKGYLWLWLYLALPIHFLMTPIQGAIVNWYGHKYGYRNFETNDRSTNTLAWDVITLGELLQNNHHRFPHRLNFAVTRSERDFTFPIVKALHRLGIINASRGLAV